MGRRARYGRAKRVLARALGSRRQEAIVATKSWASTASEGRAQATEALDLFERVEIYQVHNLVNWKAQLRLLEGLKAEGKVVAGLGVETWAQAVLKWIASDPRVSGVLTATKTPGRPTENAAAGDPPWWNPEQRDRLLPLAG